MEKIRRSNAYLRRYKCGYHERDILNTDPSIDNRESNDLREKILRCVGVEVNDLCKWSSSLVNNTVDAISCFRLFQVNADDRMTTNICESCFEKINEFISFRQLCAATDIQLRRLLRLPVPSGIDDTRKSIADKVSINYGGLAATKRILPDSNVKYVEPWVRSSVFAPVWRSTCWIILFLLSRKKRKTMSPDDASVIQNSGDHPCAASGNEQLVEPSANANEDCSREFLSKRPSHKTHA